MKKRKNAARKILLTIVLLTFIGVFTSTAETWNSTLAQSNRMSYVQLWTDRGCGGHYNEGETITIYFRVVSPASEAIVSLLDHTTEDTQYFFHKTMYTTNDLHYTSRLAECPAGLETLEIQVGIPLQSLPPDVASTYYDDIHLSATCHVYIDPPCSQDRDRDGFYPPGDCDDQNPLIHPGSVEICDGRDNDCDTQVDEGCYSCLADWDNDSFPECNDCNDHDRDVFPGAGELCDEKDNDCDGLIDEECCLCYDDNDMDGFSDCYDPNDNDPYVYPGAPALSTQEEGCPGYVDKESFCHYAEIWTRRKCGASYSEGESIEIFFRVNSTAYTAKVTVSAHLPSGELINLVEDRTISTNTTNSVTKTVTCPQGLEMLTITATVTIDGVQIPLTGECAFHVINCRAPDYDQDGYPSVVHGGNDCNDEDPSVHPGAEEVCDGKDNNCDGVIDEGFTDNDGDGYTECADCDDTDANVYPGAEEACDGKDNNCDGVIDEGFTDNDGDGHTECTDCNDTDPGVYPGAEEIQDGKDNDCDGEVDERITMDQIDDDNDGYTLDKDCNDKDPSINPGATELCSDGIDNDCDGFVDCEDSECELDSACERGFFDLTRIFSMIDEYRYFVVGIAAGVIAIVMAFIAIRMRKKVSEERETPVSEVAEEIESDELEGLGDLGEDLFEV